MNNELRSEMQQKAIETLFRDRNLIVEWGTGVGKSRVAVGAVTRTLQGKGHNILLLVSETAHKGNWRREFTETLGEETGEDVFSCLTVECYESLRKCTDTVWDLVIADEAHHLRSELRTDLVSCLQTTYFLCLTATMSDNDDALDLIRMLEVSFGRFSRMKFSMDEAIQSKILAEPEIYVHVLDLKAVKKHVCIEVTWGWPNARKEYPTDAEGFRQMWEHPEKYPNVKALVDCTPAEGYAILNDVFESCKTTFERLDAATRNVNLDAEQRARAVRDAEYAKNRMLQYSIKRKKLLGECKTAYAEHIIRDVVKQRKFICFCSSIEQGTQLNAETIIHSRRSPRENEEIIASFNEDRTRSIFAVNMLQEGANLARIEAGVIIQLDKKQRPFIQKFGRTMRSAAPEQHIIVFNHSKYISYLKNILEGISGNYIKYIDGQTGRRIS